MMCMHHQRDERGFTLIEVMIVVVIVAVLAAIAVPSFVRDANTTKVDTEVNAMFAELSAKQERHKSENGAYLAVAECPTPASSTLKPVASCMTAGSPWVALGILPPEQLRCSYEVYVGDSATAPTAPAGATVNIPSTYVATGWYMIHARCDIDNDGTLSHRVYSSFDLKAQVTNRGE